MVKRTQTYRKVYVQHYGQPPKDEFGRIYDIHHLDGDHTNNDPLNLKAIPIQEHYDIHFEKQDWKSCVMIGLRMKLPPEEISKLNSLAAQKRVKEGSHHWTTKKHASDVSARVKRLVEEGTYHMLGGEIQRSFQNERVKNKTHQWCGHKNVSPNTQVKWVCPHCGLEGKNQFNGFRWHFDNCRKKV
jgi:hypothetical protein